MTLFRALLPAFTVAAAMPAFAQDRMPSHCIAIAQSAPGIEYASAADFVSPLDEFTVRLRYVDHSMFLIRTPGGLSAATDFTGYLGPTTFLPDVVTMNNAHSTHWTSNPSPDIPHVLRGWAEAGQPADHHLDLGEMLVRNVPTDVRSGFDGVREAGNSIFVFEVAGLCIGHLGHLHHEPDEFQYAALGRLDVVMAPVDGGMTLDLPTMIRVLKRLRSSVVVPMHWFSLSSLDRFLVGMQDEFAIEVTQGSTYEVSLRSLPDRPTVVVLRPEFLDDE
jgi:L-ascorbate metabolism protein UlaG (beta-lactamase superfamily)